jgi:hypothetical protein
MSSLVIHHRDLARHPGGVYCGREHSGRGHGPSFKRSPWANPWNHRKVGRSLAISLYVRWILGDEKAAEKLPPGRWHKPTLGEIRDSLAGRVLACHCAPAACHCDFLAAVAAGERLDTFSID